MPLFMTFGWFVLVFCRADYILCACFLENKVMCNVSALIIYYPRHVLPVGYSAFARYWLTRGYTPLFEWLCKDVVVGVVRPKQDRLVLLALRENSSGRYLDPTQLHRAAMVHSVPLTPLMDVPHELIEGNESEAIVQALQQHVRDLDTGVEGGCVTRYNHHMHSFCALVGFNLIHIYIYIYIYIYLHLM